MKINWILVALLAIVVFGITVQNTREEFTSFNFTRNTEKEVVLNDPVVDLSQYERVEVEIGNDLMSEMVTKTNEEISRRVKSCTAIIETTQVRKYTNKANDVYEVMFMASKLGGFSHVFAVVATLAVKNGAASVLALRSQPLGFHTPGDVSAYESDGAGRAFTEYKMVKEKVAASAKESQKLP